jgi:import receptor subunit TOM22
MAGTIVKSGGSGSSVGFPRALSTAGYASKKLVNSFKKAAWIASTTMLVLMVPLIIEMDREQQILEMEKQQMDVLTGPAKL